MLELLEKLVGLPGVSGHEERVCSEIQARLRAMEYRGTVDRLGNLTLTIGQGRPHVVLAAHMDEIGLVVTYVEDNGRLRFTTVGGLDKRVLPGRVVIIDTGSALIHGVIGLLPPHLMRTDADRNKILEPEDMLIDIGAQSREEAQSRAVAIRNPVVLRKEFLQLAPGFFSARSLDDRAGCAVLLEVLSKLRSRPWKGKLTFAWTVQEEVGLRGATALASSMQADIVFPVDTLSSGDIPEVPFHRSPAIPGEGPALRFLDRRAIATPKLVQSVLVLANRCGIPVQVAATGGGTDGAAFQLQGCSMLPIAFPLRYTHSPVELLHYRDLENAVELICEIIANLEEIDGALQMG